MVVVITLAAGEDVSSAGTGSAGAKVRLVVGADITGAATGAVTGAATGAVTGADTGAAITEATGAATGAGAGAGGAGTGLLNPEDTEATGIESGEFVLGGASTFDIIPLLKGNASPGICASSIGGAPAGGARTGAARTPDEGGVGLVGSTSGG